MNEAPYPGLQPHTYQISKEISRGNRRISQLLSQLTHFNCTNDTSNRLYITIGIDVGGTNTGIIAIFNHFFISNYD